MQLQDGLCVMIRFPSQDEQHALALRLQPSPRTHTLTCAFAWTALAVGSPPKNSLGAESTLLVPASQVSFCMALGCRRCFAAPLRVGKGEAREGF